MNKYVKSFFLRGAIFSGFGPIIIGIIYLILSFAIDDFTLSGYEVFLAILSVYLLAFIHAGASVFNQIEGWSTLKSLVFHLGSLYIAYTACYLLNTWVPFEWIAVLIFTGAFVLIYFAVWITVFTLVKLTSKKLNEKLEK